MAAEGVFKACGSLELGKKLRLFGSGGQNVAVRGGNGSGGNHNSCSGMVSLERPSGEEARKRLSDGT